MDDKSSGLGIGEVLKHYVKFSTKFYCGLLLFIRDWRLFFEQIKEMIFIHLFALSHRTQEQREELQTRRNMRWICVESYDRDWSVCETSFDLCLWPCKGQLLTSKIPYVLTSHRFIYLPSSSFLHIFSSISSSLQPLNPDFIPPSSLFSSSSSFFSS